MIIIRCKQCGFSNFVEKPKIVFNKKHYEREKKLYGDLIRIKQYYTGRKVEVDEVVSDLKKRGYPDWFIEQVIRELGL